MSATSGTQASTNKGETTTSSSKSSKSGYDHLDINKLYKGKSTEPVAKTVTQKHGMQALGKALPARRPGGSAVVKADPAPAPTSNNTNDLGNSSASAASTALPPPPQQQQQQQQPKPPQTIAGQPSQQYPPLGPPQQQHHPGWNSSQNFPPPGSAPQASQQQQQQRPPGPQSPHHPHQPPPPHHHQQQHPPHHHHHHPQQHPQNSSVPNAVKTGGGGPPGSMHDKNWSGGPPHGDGTMLNNNRGGPPGGKQNFPPLVDHQMQRFAQEFPSLDSGGADTGKGGSQNASMGKGGSNQDNQYGPGPILRPQTEGSWTQGGGRGVPRPPGPPPPSSSAASGSSSTREYGPGAERPNMGGPTPPPMSLGPGGHPPPPLGAFPMQFPPRPPYMYPNSGPGGPPGGPGFYPPGPGGMPRYGMPIPAGAPPPQSGHPQDGGPPGGEGGPPPRRAGRGPPPGPMRPASHFASKPIIKAEELERMDELGQQDGGWATVQDDIDYNKKISFSDDEGQGHNGGDKENSRRGGRGGHRDRDDGRGDNERNTPRDFRDEDNLRDNRRDDRGGGMGGRPMKILERPSQSDSRGGEGRGDPRDRYGESTSDRDGPPSGRYQNDYNDRGDQEEDWKRKPAPGFEGRGDRGDRGPPLSQQNRGGRMMNRGPPPREEEDSWRSGNNNRGNSNFEDDPRKKGPSQQDRRDGGGPLSGRGDRERPTPGGTDKGGRDAQRESGDAGRRGPNERSSESSLPAGTGIGMRGVGGGGGGAGDFGPASGPFQSNLPPRLQRHYPTGFSQQQERNSQRKTPSPVPSGNAVNKERDYRDRSDRDWDRNDRNDRNERSEPQRPTYKILERNRGDSESSKDSSSHRNSSSRFGSQNDHRDSKDSSKRLSSDSGRLLLEDDKKDLDSMDSSYDSLRGRDISKTEIGKAPTGMGRWADEVDDDQDYNSSDLDQSANSRKGSLIRDHQQHQGKRDHQVYPEERRPPPREMPRRVIIQQTKVENMKSELPPERKQEAQTQELPKQPEPPKPVEPVKVEPKVVEKPKQFTAWGDRERSNKAHHQYHQQDSQDQMSGGSKEGSVGKDSAGERDGHSSEKEIGKDGKEKGDGEGEKGHGSRDKLDRDGRHYDNRYDNRGGGRYGDKGRDNRGDPRGDRDRERDNRQKPRRIDSYSDRDSNKRDNRTPDREREFGGRGGRDDKEKTEKKDGKEVSGKDNKEEYDRRDDYDRGPRGGGGRGKERGGYGVYQPRGGDRDRDRDNRDRDNRGGWGRDDRDKGGRGGNRGRGTGRDFYDKPSGRGGERSRGGDGEKEDIGADKERGNKEKDTASDLSNKGSVEDLGKGRKEKGVDRDRERESQQQSQRERDRGDDKGKKSPGTQRRSNNVRGGGRLQGYGPPSDKTPFSSGQPSGKEEREREDKREGGQSQEQNSKPAPVPLMALGDISPPNLQGKGGRGSRDGGRELGERGGRGGRGMPMRMGRDEYGSERGQGGRDGFRSQQQQQSDRRDGGQKSGSRGGRGGSGAGDAKPLMSINSNEVEGNEWESAEEDVGAEEDKRQQQSSRKESGSVPPQDSSSNDLQKKKLSSNINSSSGSGGGTIVHKAAGQPQSSASDGQLNQNSKSQQGGGGSSSGSGGGSSSSSAPKDRRIKNPPYDPRPSSKNTWDNKQAQSSTGKDSSSGVNQSHSSQQHQQQQQQPIGTQSSNSPQLQQDGKDEVSGSGKVSSGLAVGSGVSGSSVLDNSGPLKTMIFENTNYKSINSASSTSGPGSGQQTQQKLVGKGTIGEGKKETGAPGLGDFGGLTFGKVEDSSDIGFGTFSSSSQDPDQGQGGREPQSIPPTSVSTSNSVPKPIGQPPRGFNSHQPSPISPQAADLTEKLQGVKRIWDPIGSVSTMPSVQEQMPVVSAGDDSSFHGGFGSETFKGDGGSASQFGGHTSSGYAPGTSPALSAISKPESSSSPTSSSLRQQLANKQQAQQGDGSSGQGSAAGQISSSPFGNAYTMQPQGNNAFGGIPAVPSPPSVMAYGTSQALHAASTGPHSGMYQAFPEAHQVMNAASAGRPGYGQFQHHTAGSGQYGLFLSTAPMEYTSMTSYQHQQTNQGQQAGQTSRISPGPMTTTGGANSGVIISSSNSLMNAMKQGGQGTPGGSHPMSHTNPQGYSQSSHHYPGAAIGTQPPHSHPHAPPPHHLGPVGPAKPPGGYNQGGGLGTPNQAQPVFIPFHDPTQHQAQGVISLGGQSFLSQAIGRGPGGPPPPQTPPVQALQNASSYYSGSSGSQGGVFPGQGSNQGGGLQQLHVAVANPQAALQGYQSASHLGLQYPTQLNLQGYNQQAAASTVSALNLNSQLMRNAGPPQSHSAYMKQQPSMDLIGGSQLKSSHDQTLMNQNTWGTTAAYSLNQAFHVAAAQQQQQQGKAPGSNPNDNRQNPGGVGGQQNAIGGQRKGNNLGGGGQMKYMSQGAYSGQVQQQ